jgi:LytS/YehU family sensor histidine kinase
VYSSTVLFKGVYMKKITTTFSVIAIAAAAFSANPAAAMEKGILSVFGPIIAMPIGAVSGLVRGTLSKSSEYADSFSKELGDGLPGRAIGVPTGFVTGAVAGSATGVLKGLYTGLVLGVIDPLSARSASVDGKVLDYEPYTIFQVSRVENVQ